MEKRYNHQQSESEAQQLWETQQTYSVKNNPGPTYTIDTPPPTISGNLHIGHIFSYTQTDILARYKRMNGFSVFYPFGFDDNGLPTERYVEKKRKVRGHTMPRSEFTQLCITESKEAAKDFKELWQRMGLSADWNSLYSTISDSTRKISQTSFIELYKKGYVYRKYEPALYCTTCRTSVAQAELDDQELPSMFNNIIFKDAQGNDLIVATTRPELLPSCVALIFNPNDERYQHLRRTKAKVPLFNLEAPVLEDELVDMEKGSGLVMICTFGDKTDIIWYKKFDLPYRQSIGLDGKFTKTGQFLEGLKVTDARAKVIEELRNQNLLISQKEITHAVSVHERCKKAIEFTVLPQWFIKILPHKKKFIALADQIVWHPTFMKARYKDWVENLAWDWCISRQRFYGIPFPAWHCQDCDEILLADVKNLPIDPQETSYSGTCTKCKSKNIMPDTDVMDTWNTSSLTPYICYDLFKSLDNTQNETVSPFYDVGTQDFLPMSMRPQAHDIIRTWAFDTIVKTWMHHNIIPWKDIVISGHVLSDQKKKLSKKEGTALLPEKLLAQYPADAIRYWTATGRLGSDISFSQEQLKIGVRLITKLWNAFRFAHPHLQELHVSPSGDTQDKQELYFGIVNKWLLHTISESFKKYRDYLEAHEFGLALGVIEQFFWNNFCDNYLELIKHQLFNPADYNKREVYATRWTLYQAGLRILQMYAPYVPHVTETIYRLMYSKDAAKNSIHQTRFTDIQNAYIFTDQAELMETIINVVSQVRKLKSEQQLSLKVPLETLAIHSSNSTLLDNITKHEQLLRGITQAKEIRYKKSAATVQLEEREGLWHARIVM